MRDSTIILLSIPVSISLYLILFCSINRFNCMRNNSLNLPLGTSHLFGPFMEFFKGRFRLAFNMLFTFQNPWLFIILGILVSFGYIIYRRITNTETDEDDDDEES